MNKTADVVLSAEDVKMLSHLIDNVQRAAQDNNPKTVIASHERLVADVKRLLHN